MAEVKISQLPDLTPTPTSLIPIVEGGASGTTTPARLLVAGVKAGNGSYTLAPEDVGQVVVSNVSTPATFTLTDSASFPVGGVIEVVQEAAGQLTIAEGAGTTIKRSRFSSLELKSEGSTVRLRKQSAGTWVASGDLKEKQPVAVFEFDNASVSGSTQQIDFNSAGGIGGSSSGIFTTSGLGGAVKFLVPGVYTFSGAITMEDSNSTAERQVGLTLRRNGPTLFSFQGLRETSSASVRAMVHVFGTQRFEADDLVTLTTNSGSITSFPGNTASRQIWVTRISD